jgi:hypothetical protein
MSFLVFGRSISPLSLNRQRVRILYKHHAIREPRSMPPSTRNGSGSLRSFDAIRDGECSLHGTDVFPLYSGTNTTPSASQGPSQSRSLTNEQHDVTGSQQASRRRAVIACLRCRNRKIRCSGPGASDERCDNCETVEAQVGECIFVKRELTGRRENNVQALESKERQQARLTPPGKESEYIACSSE